MKVVPLRPELRDPSIARTLDAMSREPARRWTLAELARLAGTSRAVFARRFRRATGRAPLRHLTVLRMRFVAERLATNPEKLAAIAALVGYTSEFAFAKAVGVSPGSFRDRRNDGAVRAAA